MAQVVQSIDGTLKVLRIIHSALLLSMILYIFVAEKSVVHPTRPIDHTLLASFVVVSVAIVSTAFVFRIKMIGPALGTLQTTPGDVSSLNRWRAGSIISYRLDRKCCSIRFCAAVGRSVSASVGLVLCRWAATHAFVVSSPSMISGTRVFFRNLRKEPWDAENTGLSQLN